MIRMIFIPVVVVSVLNIQNDSMFPHLCRPVVNNRFELSGEKYIFVLRFNFFQTSIYKKPTVILLMLREIKFWMTS